MSGGGDSGPAGSLASPHAAERELSELRGAAIEARMAAAVAQAERDAAKATAEAEVAAMRQQVETEVAARNAVIEQMREALAHERGRGDRLAAELTEARRPWVVRVVSALRRQ
jgi:hypothetical protein